MRENISKNTSGKISLEKKDGHCFPLTPLKERGGENAHDLCYDE